MQSSLVGGRIVYTIEVDSRELDSLSKKFSSAEKAAQNSAASISKSGSKIGDSWTEGFNSLLKSGTKAADSLVDSFATAASSISSVLSNTFTSLAGTVTGAATAMTTKGLDVGSSLEKNRLSFEALTGSVEGAETVLTSVADFAAENPYQLLDVSNVARELVAMGRSANDVEGDLAKLGAIGVATGADLGGLGHVYGQISAQGKMMTQDMYQLVNQGVAIMPALSKVTGKTMEELKDFISDGGVTMEVFQEAMSQIVDPEMYDNLLNKMNNTIPRQLDRLKGSISTFATSLVGIDKWTGQKLENGLAQTFTDILKKLADNLRNPELIASVSRLGQSFAQMANKLVPLIDKLAPALTKAFDFISDHTEIMIPILAGAAIAFGNLAGSIPGIGGVVGPLAESFKGLFKIVNPLTGGLKGMTTAFAALTIILAGIGAVKGGGLKELSSTFQETFGQLREVLNQLKPVLNEVMAKLGGALVQIIKSLLPVVPPLANAIAKLALAFASAVANIAPAIFQALATALTVLANVINAIPQPLLEGLLTALIGFLAVSKVTSVVQKFSGVLGGLATPVTKLSGAAKSGGGAVGNLIAGILKPLGNTEVLKGAASAALVGAGFYLIVSAVAKASSVSINVGNLAGMLVAMVIVSAIAGVIGIFAEFVALGGVAIAAVGAGLYIAALGLSEASKMGAQIDMGGILQLSGAIALTSIILTALLVFSAFGAVGAIATAIIGGGLALTAAGLQKASQLGSQIDMGGIALLGVAVAQTSILLTSLLLFSAFGAVGAIAAAVIGVGLAITAAGLNFASQQGKQIDMGGILLLGLAVAQTSILLTAILGFAIFGAVASIATAIIGAGLALTAAGLKSASENGRNIDFGGLEKLSLAIVMTSVILTSVLAFSVFGAIASIATSIIAGGLVLTAKGLLDASIYAAKIQPKNLQKLTQAITYVAELKTGNLWENLVNMVNTGILTKVANNVKEISETLSNIPEVRTSGVRKIKEAIGEFASISTGDIWGNIQNLINSDMLTVISKNVKEISDVLGNLKPVKKDSVTKIREAIEEFSQIKIEGNGLFEDKGGASEMLVTVARNAARVIQIFSNLQTDGLLDKFDTLEKALSRDGKGWPINWAEDFVNYINKLNEAKANFLGVAVFIQAVKVWDTGTLLDKFNEFEKAISRDGKSWEPWYAEQFVNYIKKLTSESKSLDLVNDFINKVEDWNSKELLRIFNEFENAISREGKAWEPWYAEQFMNYIKKLTSDMTSFDLVDTFIHKVENWNTIDLLKTFNDFENAISREGKSWEPWYAEQFMKYVKKLTEDMSSFDLVDTFINKVTEWNTNDLLTQFNNFENAISREGKSWEPWYAEQFSNYIKKLVEDNNSLDLVDTFINKVNSWATDDLFNKFNTFENAVSRGGQGWPMTWAQQFINYVDKLAGDGASFQKVGAFIDNVINWATDDLKTQFDKFENAVSRGGQGWPLTWATQFGNYINKLSGDGANLDQVSSFIDKVKGWATDDLKSQFDKFENAISRQAQGWPMTWANQFADYVNRLGQIGGSLDPVDSFINKVKSWVTVEEGGKSLEDAFNDFERAISRNGQGWPMTWANSFVNYFNKLSQVNMSIDGIANFVTKVKEWTSGDKLLEVYFADFERAISRNGFGWPLDFATQFVDYFNKLSEITDASFLETINQMILKVMEMQTGEETLNKFIELEKIISRNGYGYPLDWATQFVDYWNEFGNLTYDFSTLKSYIETVSGLTPENVAANVQLIVDSIQQFVDAAKGKSPDLYAVGADFADQIGKGWDEKSVPDYLLKAVTKIIDTFNGKMNEFVKIGKNTASSIINEFAKGDFIGAGRNATIGFANGLSSMVWRINVAMGQISAASVNTLKNLLGIHSPSRVMYGLGEYIGEGLAEGIESTAEQVAKASEELVEAAQTNLSELSDISVSGSLDTSASGFGNSTTKNNNIYMTNNIRNGLDLSAMYAQLKWDLARA